MDGYPAHGRVVEVSRGERDSATILSQNKEGLSAEDLRQALGTATDLNVG